MIFAVMSQKIPMFLNNIQKPWKILAPMVSNSDEAFRLLVKRYGADLCYTEMVHCRVFNDSNANIVDNQWFTTSKADRPLVIQLCGNDPEIMLKTCMKLQNLCDAFDLNFGCPQEIARKGNYGAWLMEDFVLVEKIVKTLSENIKVPLFCKIRVFESIEKTVEYAKLIEKAGCSLLTVHGRTREQRKEKTGYVSFEHIKAVKDALSIPVISNGGVLVHEDIEMAIEKTGCDGVMVAEPILYIPTIFQSIEKRNIDVFKEYLEICKENKVMCRLKYIKSHAFKMLKSLLDCYEDLRIKLDKCHELNDFYNFLESIETLDVDKKALKLKPYIRKCYLNDK